MNNSKNNDDNMTTQDQKNGSEAIQDLTGLDSLNQYLKATAGERQGRSIPPLESWNPEQVDDMDLVIKANGEWWHEGGHMTRQSLIDLFATVLWKEEENGISEYFLKTPAQKLRIQVEDVPLLINDVGIVTENEVSWLEFTTTTGDVVRLDDNHSIELRPYESIEPENESNSAQIRPYMLVRNGLSALIGRNTFYHLTEIGELIETKGQTTLTLQSGGVFYEIYMPE